MSLILDKNDKSYLNLDRERNEQNMNTLDYNCGGYALGTFTWILLDAFDHGYDLSFDDSDEDMMEEIEDYVARMEDNCVEEIVEDFEGLVRPISVLSELHEDEYAVLFRVSYDGEGYIDDFHFVKRHHDGHYSHKPGNSPIAEFEGDPFDGAWASSWLDYNAPIKILAVSNLLY